MKDIVNRYRKDNPISESLELRFTERLWKTQSGSTYLRQIRKYNTAPLKAAEVIKAYTKTHGNPEIYNNGIEFTSLEWNLKESNEFLEVTYNVDKKRLCITLTRDLPNEKS